MSPEAVRMAILLTLVVQNSAQALFMRYSFKPKDQVRCRCSIWLLLAAGGGGSVRVGVRFI